MSIRLRTISSTFYKEKNNQLDVDIITALT